MLVHAHPDTRAEAGTRCAVAVRKWASAPRRLQLLPGLAGLGAGLLGESWLPVLAGLLAVPAAGRWIRRRALRRAADAREGAVLELCGTVAGELRAGRPPESALLTGIELAETGGDFLRRTNVPAAAHYGGDLAAAFREAAQVRGAEGLSALAACWQVAVEGGAGLAGAVERVGGALQAERDQRAELRAQLAGPWTTVAVLAMLPVFGLVLGGAMGAAPWDFLLHTPAGLVCLVVGVSLEGLGLWWTALLIRSAERG